MTDKDTFWFAHDAGARNDPKILAMRSVYGSEGYGWYWMIIEMLREQPGYKYPLNKYTGNALAMQMQCDADASMKFVEDCINEFGLLQSDGTHFWSDALIRRMERWDSKRESRSEQARRAALIRWGKETVDARSCDADADAMREHSGSNAAHMRNDAIEEDKIEENIDRNNIHEDTPDQEPSSTQPPKREMVPYQKIVDLYHELCPSLPKVIKLTDARKSAIKSRWQEYDQDLETFRKLFRMAEESDFLSGRSGAWKGCNFDWLIRPNNMIKVLEGNYNRGRLSSRNSRTLDADPPSYIERELKFLKAAMGEEGAR